MLIILVALVLTAEGNGAYEIFEPCNEEDLQCDDIDIPSSFPENKKELQQICEPAIEWLTCRVQEERCEDESFSLQIMQNFLSAVNDICSENTQLHTAVVENLKCVSKLFDEEPEFCEDQESSPERTEKLIEDLNEEGLVSLTHNEYDAFRLYSCIEILNYFACQGLQIETGCGDVAKRAYVHIVQRVAPGIVLHCADFFNLVPALIRLHKLEEEKENQISEAFRKKK